MKISEFLHLALPEEQWLPTISGVLRQFVAEECYVYERQPCWYLGTGCQARLHINADGTQATFIDCLLYTSEFVQAMPVVRTVDSGSTSFLRYQRALEEWVDVLKSCLLYTSRCV